MVEKPPRISKADYELLSKKEKEAIDLQKAKYQEYLDNESKDEKFKRVIRPRLARTFGLLTNIEKMVSSPNYDVTFETINNICEKLHAKVDKIKESFKPTSKEDVNKEIDDIL